MRVMCAMRVVLLSTGRKKVAQQKREIAVYFPITPRRCELELGSKQSIAVTKSLQKFSSVGTRERERE